MATMTRFREALRDRLAGRSVSAWANEIGVSQQYLSAVLRGTKPPSLTVVRWALGRWPTLQDAYLSDVMGRREDRSPTSNGRPNQADRIEKRKTPR